MMFAFVYNVVVKQTACVDQNQATCFVQPNFDLHWLQNLNNYSREKRFEGQFFPKQALIFMCLQYKSLENCTVGKGEFGLYEQFLLFAQCFLSFWITFCHFHHLKLSSANSFSLEESKICRL